jgi:hypothetical protein
VEERPGVVCEGGGLADIRENPRLDEHKLRAFEERSRALGRTGQPGALRALRDGLLPRLEALREVLARRGGEGGTLHYLNGGESVKLLTA